MNNQPQPHQLMGYDRAITMFSPDGRLLQVEYAKKTVKQGSTAIGIVAKNGVVFVTDKRIVDKLVVAETVEKIFQIDDHIGATASGILSDARVLIERAQLRAQQHKVTFDSPVDILSIVKDLCNLKQITTQSGGLRPFGVSLLVGGIDNTGPKLFETDPTGIFFQYKATVIGEGETEIEDMLHKSYKDDLSVDDAIKLGIKGLSDFLNKDFNIERIDCAYIKMPENTFTRLSRKKIDAIYEEVKKGSDSTAKKK
ncbi:MAG TPA: archaeal proteasome endopeptidase complex subunit alpha [Candidatus Nanoarchaeia archaeon]|nr:archaeal proteasome endopeptidase complex subunit alpha [Candidatus Nanoarchaeia archaeon]